jgi:pimeloyl-ACP methyl ester carboxylesterase
LIIYSGQKFMAVTSIPTSLRKLALSIALITPILASTIPVAHAVDFQTAMTEERAWAGLTTKQATAGDVKWVYSEGGNPHNPTLLLIHGLGGSRDNWNRVAHHLTPYSHVVIPDLPGSGDSIIAADYDLQPATMTESLRRFAETIKIEKNLNVAGHSMGGAIAGLYTSLYFSDTQSLLLVDPAGVYATSKSAYLKDPTLLRQLIVEKPGDLNKVLHIAMQDPPFIPADLLVGQEKVMFDHVPTMKKLVERLILLNQSYTPDSFATVVKSIEAPTLVIWGKDDKIIDVGVVPELMSELKDKRPPLILNGVGHTPILEAEQLVVQAYLPFLAKAIVTPNKFTPPVTPSTPAPILP